MSKIGDNERKTQDRVIEFFQKQLHYTYIGNLQDRANSNIDEDRLLAYLTDKAGYDSNLAKRAIQELIGASRNMQNGLYDANKKVYSLLKYGVKIAPNVGEAQKTVYFVDFDDVANNDFAIAEEVTVVAENTKRPDLVIFVNGIALAVIELKRSGVSVSNGIRQNLTNQKANFIDQFFTTMQFCLAANESEGLRYGTLLTPEKYYLEWKQDCFTEHQDERCDTDVLIDEKCEKIEGRLYKELMNIFYKKRFLDLIHNFVIYDKGIKKVCRYNQYYAIKRTQIRLKNKGNGIVWHTQGSGKSLTMVWLSKWILANDSDARVLIVTDRDELDEQIEKNYKGVDLKIKRTKSGKDLIKTIDNFDNNLICTLIHKFGKKTEDASVADYDKFFDELKKSLPKDFSPKGTFYVFVDECHRTQSGKLHQAMRMILPNALFIGFTGTPLLKKDKATSLEVFGSYIHTYKFNQAVVDGVVLDIRYEARDVPQNLTSQDRIDQWFNIKTQGLTPRAKAKLKARWGNMQTLFSSKDRLEKIANDIIFDFATKARLADGNGNAILVADSVYSACRYYEILQNKGFKKCAIITSYKGTVDELRTDTVDVNADTENFTKYEIYNKMIGTQKVEEFEEEAKRKFVDEPANMQLLIVVDKLLTGFDAPPCTYLYIDKSMHDHGLFQAICRVNRLDGETKDFGYIVDYKELFGDLNDAMTTYTSGAFEAYDEVDVAGLIKDRKDESEKYFLEVLEMIDNLCSSVELPKESLQYQHFFCGETIQDYETKEEIYARRRENLYNYVGKLLRAYAEFKPSMTERGYSADEQKKYDEKVTHYTWLREEIGRASGDFIDLKAYEPEMRYLIDNYVVAEDSKPIGDFEDFTLLDFIIAQEGRINDDDDQKSKDTNDAVAETIEKNIHKYIVEKKVINPIYFSDMSTVLEELILQRKRGVIAYKDLIKKYIELSKLVQQPEQSSRYPDSIKNSGARRALYDNFGQDADKVIKLDNAIMQSKQEGFRNNPTKANRIKRALYAILKDEDEVEEVYKLIVEQEEY